MAWGIQTWDSSGKPNNYGIRPATLLGFFSVSSGQQSGNASYNIPSGFKMDFMQFSTGDAYTTSRRTITVSGGNISIGAAGDSSFGNDTYPAVSGYIFVFLRKI